MPTLSHMAVYGSDAKTSSLFDSMHREYFCVLGCLTRPNFNPLETPSGLFGRPVSDGFGPFDPPETPRATSGWRGLETLALTRVSRASERTPAPPLAPPPAPPLAPSPLPAPSPLLASSPANIAPSPSKIAPSPPKIAAQDRSVAAQDRCPRSPAKIAPYPPKIALSSIFSGRAGVLSSAWFRVWTDAIFSLFGLSDRVQDKEKDLKRDYRMLRDARKQSGVGWDEERCMIQAEPHLWDNLEISFGKRIKKFRKNGYFPLYDLLGSLYESQIAEGNLNFTSMAEPSERDEEITTIESDGEHDNGRELEKVVPVDEDFQVTSERDESTSAVGVAKEKLKISKKPKRSPKKPNQSSGDALVGVMKRFVDIKEKESNKDDTVDFSITRCMAELRNLEGVTGDLKVKCYDIFRCPKSCEIFINAVAEKDGSALAWLKSQIGG
nr:uncharacterized protein LOC127339409 [Lolium perenne]